jgi:poly(3-hydroxybutyrate) depolymerase
MILLIAGGSAGLFQTRRSLQQCREALGQTEAVPPAYLAELREIQKTLAGREPERSEAPLSLGEAASRIRLFLRDHNIEPRRFWISGTPPGESVEFVLRCEGADFFAFLWKVSGLAGINISYLSLKPVPASTLLDATLRIQNAR